MGSGKVVSAATIKAGDEQRVQDGGVASATTIRSDGQQSVEGGVASGTTISSGGLQYVASSGVANGTTISRGGLQYVVQGGVAIDTTIDVDTYFASGGWQAVNRGGVAIDTTISNDTTASSDGWQVVREGGIASGTTLSCGGYQRVYSGCVTTGIKQKIGGNIIVDILDYDSTTRVSGKSEKGAFLYSNGVASNFIWLCFMKVLMRRVTPCIYWEKQIYGGRQRSLPETATFHHLYPRSTLLLNTAFQKKYVANDNNWLVPSA